MKRKIQIVVIGNSKASNENKEIAYQTGKVIGKSQCLLITGGRGGVMEEASRGAQETGGLVLSIVPGDSLNESNQYSDIVIPSGIGYARNMINALSGDLVVAIGGEAGTLSEIAYAWQFKKTIFAYTNDGWAKIIAEKGYIDTRQTESKVKAISSTKHFEEEYLKWLQNFSK